MHHKDYMHIFTILISILFSSFSTAVMSYISMATAIGPWIAPTLTLFGLLIFKLIPTKNITKSLALVVASGSVGGIIATAFGFCFPTLYFLDQDLFNSWMANPIYFGSVLASLSLTAGGLGLIIANLLEERLLIEDELPFPIGQLVYKMIAVTRQVKKAYELMIGFISTAVFCMLQDGFICMPCIIPKACVLVPSTQFLFFNLPVIQFDIWPMLWAIGFVTGHVIAVPLVVGAIAKLVLVDPLNRGYFTDLTNIEFVLAFASGMVLYGAIISFISVPGMLKNGIYWMRQNGFKGSSLGYNTQQMIEWVLVLLGSFAFFTYFELPFGAQLFVLLGAFACTYQIAIIAGKVGLAPLGRFATFVMIPTILLFNVDYSQIVIIATFVQICGGVTADILFGRKMAQLAKVDRREIVLYQWLGVITSSCVIGAVLWFLINHFQLGSPELFAYKAQSRQLLINAQQFNVYVLMIGALFSWMLKFLKINPMLVLGGLLMPINITLGLIFGGFITIFAKKREDWEPFWSGVFASNSIWMLLKAVF